MNEMPFVPSENLAGRYQLLSDLSEHGDSLTWRAMDLKLEQEVVIKKLPLAKAREWKQLELFEREAKTLQHLHHPGIPKLIDYFRSEDKACLNLILEQVQGQNLEQKLASGWRPTEAEVMSLAEKVLDILEYLHGHQPPVVHRDIKPSNLMLDTNQQIHLIDFGSVQQALQSKERTVVGTFGYMAPEQFSGAADPRSDLYSLGATLLHLLSGKPPAELPKKGLKINFQNQVDCSPALQDWLASLLEPVPDKRCRSAQAAKKNLKLIQLEKYRFKKINSKEKAIFFGFGSLLLIIATDLLISGNNPEPIKNRLALPALNEQAREDTKIPEFGDALHKGFCLHKPDPRRTAQTSKEAIKYRKLYIEPNLGHYPTSIGVYIHEKAQYRGSATTPADLLQIFECRKTWGSERNFDTYTEALQLILNWPLDDDSVMTGLYVLTTIDEGSFSVSRHYSDQLIDLSHHSGQLIDLFNFAFEHYFNYQPPKSWNQPSHPLAAITNYLAKKLSSEKKYALAFEKLERALKMRGADFTADDRLMLSISHARMLYEVRKDSQALNEITRLIAANPKSKFLSEMNVLRNQYDPNPNPSD